MIAGKSSNDDILTSLGNLRLEQLLDGRIFGADEILLQETGLLIELLNTALNDTVENGLRLALLHSLGPVYAPLVLQDGLRDIGTAHILR